jgi:hypothetical protein
MARYGMESDGNEELSVSWLPFNESNGKGLDGSQ